MTYTDSFHESLISLLRIPFGGSISENLFECEDWMSVSELAAKQGVSGVAFDGIQKLPRDCMPDMDTLMDWLGQTSYMEEQYKAYQDALRKLCNLYEYQGMKVLILKGYGLSQLYPEPMHRPCGDIDIYLMPQKGSWDAYTFGNQLMERDGIEVDYKSEKHSKFCYEGFTIENHVNFFHIQVSRTEAKAEKVMQDMLAVGGLNEYKKDGMTCYFPSPQMNYFYLLRHMAAHFRNRTSVTLRHLIDWGVFLHQYGKDVDLARGQKLYRDFGLVRLNDIFTSLAAEVTGYDLSAYIINKVDAAEKARILQDILNQEPEVVPKGRLAKIVYKTKEFFRLTWKYKYFNDNMEKAYFGLVNNIMH